jgi:hypothetical protein
MAQQISARVLSFLTPSLSWWEYTDGLGADFSGHIDELRVSAVARWTSNFTPLMRLTEYLLAVALCGGIERSIT